MEKENINNEECVMINGTFKMKCGNVKEESPVIHSPTYSWNRSTMGIMPDPNSKLFFFGNEMILKKGLGQHYFPIPLDEQPRYNHLDRLWDFCLSECGFQTTLTDGPIRRPRAIFPNSLVISELSTETNDSKYFEFLSSHFFEKSYHKDECQKMTVCHTSLMGLLGSGETSGCVLDLGFSKTSTCLFQDGNFYGNDDGDQGNNKCFQKIGIGGKNVYDSLFNNITTQFADHFRGMNTEPDDTSIFLYSCDFRIFEKPFQDFSYCRLPKQFEQQQLLELDNDSKIRRNDEFISLPDGNILEIPNKTSFFVDPFEVLFHPSQYFPTNYPNPHNQPEFLSPPTSLVLNHQHNMSLFGSNKVVLMGGVSMFNYVPERIEHELKKRSSHNLELIVMKPKKKRYMLDWLGGKLISSMYPDHVVQKNEISESGAVVIFKKKALFPPSTIEPTVSWNFENHKEHEKEFRSKIFLIVCCCYYSRKGSLLYHVPLEVVFIIISFLERSEEENERFLKLYRHSFNNDLMKKPDGYPEKDIDKVLARVNFKGRSIVGSYNENLKEFTL